MKRTALGDSAFLMEDVRAVAEWSLSERLVFLGRLRHGPASRALSQKIIDEAEAALMDSADMVALDLVRSSAEALEAAEKRRVTRAEDLVRRAISIGHPLADGAMDEASQIVSLAEALAAEVAAVRQAVDDVQESILLATAEISAPPADVGTSALALLQNASVGAASTEKADPAPTEPLTEGRDAGGGVTERCGAFIEKYNPSEQPDEATFDQEIPAQQVAADADISYHTSEPEELITVVPDPENRPEQSEQDPECTKPDTALVAATDDGVPGETGSIKDGGADLPVERETTVGLQQCYVHALPRYLNAMLLSGPGGSSGRGVVQAVDALLAGRHTLLISDGVDLAKRRVFAAVLSAWHALGREINVTDNVARVMQRLGAVIKSRLAPKRGIDLGDAEAVRIFEATVVPTTGLFDGCFIPLSSGGKHPVEIVVVWTHPQRVAQVLWRLPASNVLRVVLVMTTLNHAHWRDVNAALVGRGSSAVFDTGFIWWIGSKASEVLSGAWESPPKVEISLPAASSHSQMGMLSERENATAAGSTDDTSARSAVAVSEEAVATALTVAADAVIDDANDVGYTEILPRRHFWNKPWCWSPLAEDDEKAILSGPKHAWALLGTRAGGLDLVNDFLLLAKPGIDPHPITDVGSPKDFRVRLQQFASLRSGQHIVLVRPQTSLERAHWSAVSGVVGNARRFGAKSLRVVVLVDPWVDPTSARLAVDGLLGRELGIASLAPLDDEELAEWTRVASSNSPLTAASLRNLANDLGRWVGALSDAVDAIRGQTTNHAGASDLVARDVGLSAEMEAVLERLPTVRGSNPLDPPVLMPDTTPPWLLRCGAVRRGEDGSLRIDPVLWRVLTNQAVVTS